MQIDTGSVQYIAGIQIQPRCSSPAQYVTQVDVYVSETNANDASYTLLGGQTEATGLTGAAGQTENLCYNAPLLGRYVRIYPQAFSGGRPSGQYKILLSPPPPPPPSAPGMCTTFPCECNADIASQGFYAPDAEWMCSTENPNRCATG